MDNFTPYQPEKLVQYLDGDLTGSERDAMEQQLAADPSLRQEYESLLATRAAVRYYGLQQQVAAIHAEMMPAFKTPVRTLSGTRRMIRYSIAVAAGLLLLIGSYLAYQFYTLSSEKVFASNYRSFEAGVLRGDDTDPASGLEKLYEEKEYKAVTALRLDRAFTAKEHFLRGMSFAELNNPAGAIEEYKKVLALNKTKGANLYIEDAEYFLALAYIRNKDYDFALDILHAISGNSAHLYHDRVNRKLIRQVKWLKWR
jgi:hypothetical protein